MKILLVEPSYKNKYPPVGLMKISTYHNQRNDVVYFAKGKNDINLDYDCIYITTLFTFHYHICIDEIDYYETKYPNSKIFVGGIMASILAERLRSEVADRITILTGQLTTSSILGFDDEVNIDTLPLDYNILHQIDYQYKTEDGYITYTTRGCTNRCHFCAVPKLEPEFFIANNLEQQVNFSKDNYGEKRDLLLLDNNILSLDIVELRQIVDEIKELGYSTDNNELFIGDTHIEKKYKKIEYLEGYEDVYENKIVNEYIAIREEIQKKYNNKMNKKVLNKYAMATRNLNVIFLRWYFTMHKEEVLSVSKIIDRRRGQSRYVDFNQGMDARQLTEEKMKILSEIPIRPFRLALDDVKTIPIYERSIRLAVKYGVKNFSNYLLYNFNDTPEDMYTRLRVNIDLAEELNINIYSFPMKYADIYNIDRNNVGENWNKYYLANFRRILKPTMGVVGKGRSYFNRAFGETYEDFLKILQLPFDFVTYRKLAEDQGLIRNWEEEFELLDNETKNIIFHELSNSNYKFDHDIMKHYRIRKKCF